MVTRKTALWAFQKGELFRSIASLELVASLIGLMVLLSKVSDGGDSVGLVGLPVRTDNQGNTFLLDRMLTTKYPLGVVLMELSHQCRVGKLVLRAHWIPLLENEEADALTNLDFSHFSANNRVEVGIDILEFGVLPRLFNEGQDYMKELAEARRGPRPGRFGLLRQRRIEGTGRARR